MNKLLLPILVLSMALVTGESYGEGKISLSVGGDVLLPMGDFGDVASTGFGGSVRGQYHVNNMFCVTLTTGYFMWSGKDQTVSGISIKGTELKGIPIMVGGKAYFMPEGNTRVYGMVEAGLFLATVTVPSQTINIGGINITTPEVSANETEFAYAPVLGVEFAAGGNTMIDVSARWFAISTDPSSNSIGFRAGVNFGLGN